MAKGKPTKRKRPTATRRRLTAKAVINTDAAVRNYLDAHRDCGSEDAAAALRARGVNVKGYDVRRIAAEMREQQEKAWRLRLDRRQASYEEVVATTKSAAKVADDALLDASWLFYKSLLKSGAPRCERRGALVAMLNAVEPRDE